MIAATQMRPGNVIKHDGELYSVFSVIHRTPGNLRAFVQAKLRNLRTGSMIEHRFRSEDRIDQAILDETEMQFLYRDDRYHFMDTESYEQLSLSPDEIGAARDYLKENTEVDVLYIEGAPVAVELPNFVELAIARTDPGVRGDTAQGGTKPATLETGAVLQVPLFLSEGDTVKVDTRTGEYLGRVAAAGA